MSSFGVISDKNNKRKLPFMITLVRLDEYGQEIKNPEILSTDIKINPYSKLKTLKGKIAKVYNVPTKNISLFFKNTALIDDLTISDYNIAEHKKHKIQYQIVKNNQDWDIRVYGCFPCHTVLEKIIEEIKIGFLNKLKPLQTEDEEGTSGVYKLRNNNKEIRAIFKPFDEEPFTPNNHKGYKGKFGSSSFREGILSGEGTFREVAAFLIDRNNKFEVPQTSFIEIAHWSFDNHSEEMMSIDSNTIKTYKKGGIIQKFLLENVLNKQNHRPTISTYSSDENDLTDESHFNYMKTNRFNYVPRKYGSLQKFVKSSGVAADFSSSLYSVEEVHKIAVLDLRILNCDRNEENILVRKKRSKNYWEESGENKDKFVYKLIPIDHALSFPDCLKIYDFEICWTSWDQAQVEFSQEMKEYIKNINILEDMRRISQYIKLRENCWKYLRVSNTVLKECAKYNLTLYEISQLIYQLDYDSKAPSKVAIIVKKIDERLKLYKEDKRRNRIFSTDETASKFKAKKEAKEGTLKKEGRKTSLLIRTESEPNLNYLIDKSEDEKFYRELRRNKNLIKKDRPKLTKSIDKKVDSEEKDLSEDDYSGLKVNKSIEEEFNPEEIFNNSFYDLYFQYFIKDLRELIKEQFPEKYEKYESMTGEKNIEFELQFDE